MRAATIETDEIANLITIYRVEDDEENLWVRVPGADIASVKLNSKIGRVAVTMETNKLILAAFKADKEPLCPEARNLISP